MEYGRLPIGPYRSIVKRRGSPYTLYTEGVTDGYEASTTVTNTQTSAQLYLYEPSEAPSEVPTGQLREGTINGVCIPNDDGTPPIEDDHIVQHGGSLYEMTVTPWPDKDNPRLFRCAGTERTDLSV
jgi:hypothetical protein